MTARRDLKTVLAFFDSAAHRVARAGAVCRARRDGDAEGLGWAVAAALLDEALGHLRAAGATTNETGRASAILRFSPVPRGCRGLCEAHGTQARTAQTFPSVPIRDGVASQ